MLLKWAFGLLCFLIVFSVGYAAYTFFFGYDKLLAKMEENTRQLSEVVERNRQLEAKLAETEKGIKEVHKSLLQSQIKLTGLIKDTRGSTLQLNENANIVKDDLTGIINEIEAVLAAGGNHE